VEGTITWLSRFEGEYRSPGKAYGGKNIDNPETARMKKLIDEHLKNNDNKS